MVDGVLWFDATARKKSDPHMVDVTITRSTSLLRGWCYSLVFFLWRYHMVGGILWLMSLHEKKVINTWLTSLIMVDMVDVTLKGFYMTLWRVWWRHMMDGLWLMGRFTDNVTWLIALCHGWLDHTVGGMMIFTTWLMVLSRGWCQCHVLDANVTWLKAISHDWCAHHMVDGIITRFLAWTSVVYQGIF